MSCHSSRLPGAENPLATAPTAATPLQVLAGQLLLDAVRAYNAVAEAAALLPSSQAAADAADAADTAGGGDGGELPQMLRAQWRGGLPQLDCVPCEPGDGLAAQAAAACARYALHVVQPEALQPRPATVLEEVAAPGAQQAQRRRGRQPAAPAPALAVVEDRGVPISREAFAAAAAAQAAAKAQDAAPAAAPAAAAAELAEPAHTPAAAPPVLLGVVEDAVVEQRTRNGAVEVSSLMGGEARGHLYRRTTAVLGLGGPQAQQQAQPEEAQQRAPQGVQQQQRQPAKPAAALAALAAPKPPAAASKPAFLAVGALAAKPAAAARPAFVSVAVQPAKLAGVAAEPAAAAGAPAAAAGAPAAPAAQPAAPAAQPAAQPALGGAAGRKRKKAAAAAEAPATEAAAAEPKSWEDWLDPLGGGLGGGPAAAASPAQPGAKPQQGKRRRGR